MAKFKKEYFDTEDELLECVREWKKRLGLSDWHIACRLAAKNEMELEGVAGESDVQWENMIGTISILRREDMPKDLIIKQPHEATVIHELLHFKFFALEDKTREEAYYEMKQHQLLEEMARALFSAKYDIDFEWWEA